MTKAVSTLECLGFHCQTYRVIILSPPLSSIHPLWFGPIVTATAAPRPVERRLELYSPKPRLKTQVLVLTPRPWVAHLDLYHIEVGICSSAAISLAHSPFSTEIL